MILISWFKLHRSVFDHWVSTDAEAFLLWQYIIGMAAYEPTRKIELGRLIELKPGQLLFRGPQLADRLHIDRNKIYRLIALFEQDDMITVQKFGKRYSIISVKNYSVYQGESLSIEKIRETNEKPKHLELCEFEGSLLQQSEKQIRNKRETIYKKDNKNKKEEKEYTPKINQIRIQYSNETLSVIDRYLDILKGTRKSNKIADSVLFQIYEQLNKFPEVVIRYGCNAVINNPSLHSKKENYFYGILRNTTEEEAKYKQGKGAANDGKTTKPSGSGYDTSKIINSGPIKEYGDINI